MQTDKKSLPKSKVTQLVVNFVLPTLVLLTLSNESRLGPKLAMLVALAFPVVYEIYSLTQRRKPSILSVVAIVGILLTGAISMLGLSENWLALRRSAPYMAIAIALFVSILVKRSLVLWALQRIVDMPLVQTTAEQKHVWASVRRRINLAGYMFVALFLAIGVSNYILTLAFITAPTDSAQYNNEYAQLRMLSLPAITLPLLVGAVAIVMYLLASIEKLTGLGTEKLLQKK